jgi:hypothetical protein
MYAKFMINVHPRAVLNDHCDHSLNYHRLIGLVRLSLLHQHTEIH